jgi:hypothetical protein
MRRFIHTGKFEKMYKMNGCGCGPDFILIEASFQRHQKCLNLAAANSKKTGYAGVVMSTDGIFVRLSHFFFDF